MPATQLEVRAKEFKREIVMLSQQMGSRLVSSVNSDSADAMSDRKNTMDSVESVKKTQLHQPTQETPVTWASRWRFMETWSNSDWIDVTQAAGSAVKLDAQQSAVAQVFAAALGRVDDGVILRAIGGSATTGETGGSTSSFDTNFDVAISSHANDPQSGSGDTGLTSYKLETSAALIGAQGGSLGGMLHVALRQRQLTRLMSDTRVSSKLYQEAQIVGMGPGYKGTWGNFRFFVLSDGVWLNAANAAVCLTGSDDYTYVYAPEAIDYGVLEALTSRAVEDKDHHFDIKLYARKTVGARRNDDRKVVRIACDATL